MPAWLAVQKSKAVIFMNLYVSINDTKYFRNSLHHTSAVPQLFLLLIGANLALAGFWAEHGAYGLYRLGWQCNRAKLYFY